ncbi:MAG: hypothetical protein EP344_02585 [Bacteroidetes bacterium]|nr:MAG: hypothetical protein EP344_02585 [Bacteroidota bacterium]
MAKKNKPKSDDSKPAVHDDLKNMDIRVNEMGEIIREYDVDEINTFLDKSVKDKKLNNQSDDTSEDK